MGLHRIEITLRFMTHRFFKPIDRDVVHSSRLSKQVVPTTPAFLSVYQHEVLLEEAGLPQLGRDPQS